jgi:uncharacterized protein
LGLGDRGQATLLFIAIGIYALQLIGSHVYLRFRAQGPMEALWRRHTYGENKKANA